MMELETRNILASGHAAERIAAREIPPGMIVAAIDNPTITYPAKDDERRRVYIKNGIGVVYNPIAQVLITAFRTDNDNRPEEEDVPALEEYLPEETKLALTEIVKPQREPRGNNPGRARGWVEQWISQRGQEESFRLKDVVDALPYYIRHQYKSPLSCTNSVKNALMRLVRDGMLRKDGRVYSLPSEAPDLIHSDLMPQAGVEEGDVPGALREPTIILPITPRQEGDQVTVTELVQLITPVTSEAERLGLKWRVDLSAGNDTGTILALEVSTM